MSGAIETLAFRTEVDTTGWEFGLQAGNRLIDEMYAGIGQKYANLTPPAQTNPDSTGFDQLASTMAGVAGQIRSAMGGALAPLNAFSADFTRKFDQFGPVVEKLAVRIDSAMRFPEFVKRVEAFRSWFINRMGATAQAVVAKTNGELGQLDVSQLYAPVQVAQPKVRAAFLKPLDDLKAGAATRFQIFDRKFSAGVGYGLDQATHVAASGYVSFLKGLDTFKSQAMIARQAAVDAMLARPGNKGKGSRTAFNQRKANVASVAAMQASRPAVQLDSPAFKAPSTRGWEILKSVVQGVVDAEKRGSKVIGSLIRQDARDVDGLIGKWLGFQKVKELLSSFGSVAKATWQGLGKVKSPEISIDPKQSVILRGIGTAADSLGSKMRSLGVSVASALGLFGLAFKGVEYLKGGVVAASGFTETLNKTNAVLGQAAGGVIAYADTMADRFGMVKQETLDVASGFGGLYKSIGGQSGKALEQSTIQMTQMAADLSSFANMSFDEAGQALRTVLSGNESDRLKRLGYVANEAAMESMGLAMGIRKSVQEMSEAEKLAIRTRIALTTLKDATGDLANTGGSSANMWRKLTGSLTNLSAQVGIALMPAIDRGLAALTGMVGGVSTAFETGKAVLDQYVAKLAVGIDFLAAVVGQPKAAFEVLRLVGSQALMNIVEVAATLGPNLTIIAGYVAKNWQGLLVGAFDAVALSLQNLGVNFTNFAASVLNFARNPLAGFKFDWTPLLDGLQVTVDKFPALIKPALSDMSKEIGAAAKPIWDDFAKRRDEALKPAIAMNEKKADVLAGVDQAKPERQAKPKPE